MTESIRTYQEKKRKILVLHPTIAPYRIDFFNSLSQAFNAEIWLQYKNLKSQTFAYDSILHELSFTPLYLRKKNVKIGKHEIYTGIWKALRAFQPDMVIVPEFGVTTTSVIAFRLLFRKKFRIVSICDDCYDMLIHDNDFKRSHKIARKMISPLLDDLILPDNRAVSYYQQNYGKGIFFPIIYNDENLRKRYSQLLNRESASEPNSAEGPKTFLFIGRLVKIKNIETIIQAFSSLAQKENRLIIVGDGPERANLEKSSQGLNISFTGRLEGDELYQWYLKSHVFILASYREAFGAVTNEALLAGCWCLVSENAGSSCLIQEGRNGETFQAFDIKGLSEAMERSPRIEHIENRLRTNGMSYSYSALMQDLTTALNNLMEEI